MDSQKTEEKCLIVTDLKILKTVCKDTTLEEIQKLNLAGRIQVALKTGWTESVGLAAIQIGEPLNYAWYQLKDKPPVEIVNPVVVSAKGGYIYNNEGCMSLPKRRWSVYRFNTISFINHDQSPKGRLVEADGFEAVVIQHEVDHMRGLLCCEIFGPPKQGRNELCRCGSGLKHKRCCG